MATLLQGVNEVFKRVNLISGDQGELSSLTDSARQSWIDITVQAWNEVVEELYSTMGRALPQELAEATITLADGDRDYALAADLNELIVNQGVYFIDETNNHFIFKYPGSYEDMVVDQIDPADFVGLPTFAVIRPTDGQIYLERSPTATEAGRVYRYRYKKDISVSAAADTFPFKDVVFRALVPAVAQLWLRDQRNSFDGDIFRASVGRASRLMPTVIPREDYSNR